MNNHYPFLPSPYSQEIIDPNDQRIVPGVGLGLGFLGGLATGALLTPGPGFGYYPPYPYYQPYPYYAPYPYYPPYPYPYAPY